VQAAIDRVMQTFTMMTSLTPKEMQVAAGTVDGIWKGWMLTRRRSPLRGFAICAEQIGVTSNGPRGKSDDGQPDNERAA
jgi:hypothetical protein